MFEDYQADMSLVGSNAEVIVNQVTSAYYNMKLMSLGLSQDELNALNVSFKLNTNYLSNSDSGNSTFAMMMFSIVLFYAVFFCASQVSSSVTTEKTSKIIESLTTSTSPKNIVLGKTLGVGVTGLCQLAVLLIFGVICAKSFLPGAGIYYMTWVLKNKNLFGQFAWAVNIPLIIALIFTPTLVGKWKGMYKLNKRGYLLAVIGRALVVVAGYMGSIPLMMAFTAVAALGQGPWQGDMNAVIASCSEYTYLTQGKRVDGTMYSCTSLGIKLAGGPVRAVLEAAGATDVLAKSLGSNTSVNVVRATFNALENLMDARAVAKNRGKTLKD